MRRYETIPRKRAPAFSQEIQAIRTKLETDPSGRTLTRAEKKREVLKDEAAYLLSALAERTISPRYIKELTRVDKGPRLKPARVVGTTFIYTVADLLGVKFNKVQREEETEADAA